MMVQKDVGASAKKKRKNFSRKANLSYPLRSLGYRKLSRANWMQRHVARDKILEIKNIPVTNCGGDFIFIGDISSDSGEAVFKVGDNIVNVFSAD